MKIYDANNQELMRVREIRPENGELVIRGKIFGAMPMVAKLKPEEAREALKLLSAGTIWFLITLPFRRTR